MSSPRLSRIDNNNKGKKARKRNITLHEISQKQKSNTNQTRSILSRNNDILILLHFLTDGLFSILYI